jgi:hypothetical protein
MRSLFVHITRLSCSDATDRDKISPATAEDVADALAFALRFQGRNRVRNADELMSWLCHGNGSAHPFNG